MFPQKGNLFCRSRRGFLHVRPVKKIINCNRFDRAEMCSCKYVPISFNIDPILLKLSCCIEGLWRIVCGPWSRGRSLRSTRYGPSRPVNVPIELALGRPLVRAGTKHTGTDTGVFGPSSWKKYFTPSFDDGLVRITTALTPFTCKWNVSRFVVFKLGAKPIGRMYSRNT